VVILSGAKDLGFRSRVNSANDFYANGTPAMLSLLKDEILRSLRSLRMTEEEGLISDDNSNAYIYKEMEGSCSKPE